MTEILRHCRQQPFPSHMSWPVLGMHADLTTDRPDSQDVVPWEILAEGIATVGSDKDLEAPSMCNGRKSNTAMT
eukprot:6061054-Pyramimonas_sp.AAC.1